MKMLKRQSALITMVAAAGIFSSCGGVNDSSKLFGARARGGVEDNAPRHQEQEHQGELERERAGDDGAQHQERHRGGRSAESRTEQRFKSPGDQTSAKGATINLPLEKTIPGDDDAYKFEATGLPAGLTIDAATGKISGTITAEAGVYAVIVTAKELEAAEDRNAAELKFNWTVTAQ